MIDVVAKYGSAVTVLYAWPPGHILMYIKCGTPCVLHHITNAMIRSHFSSNILRNFVCCLCSSPAISYSPLSHTYTVFAQYCLNFTLFRINLLRMFFHVSTIQNAVMEYERIERDRASQSRLLLSPSAMHPCQPCCLLHHHHHVGALLTPFSGSILLGTKLPAIIPGWCYVYLN